MVCKIMSDDFPEAVAHIEVMMSGNPCQGDAFQLTSSAIRDGLRVKDAHEDFDKQQMLRFAGPYRIMRVHRVASPWTRGAFYPPRVIAGRLPDSSAPDAGEEPSRNAVDVWRHGSESRGVTQVMGRLSATVNVNVLNELRTSEDLDDRDIAFLSDVMAEAGRARDKFPENLHMLAALMEEAGEAAQALLEAEQEGGDPGRVYHELVQVASTALRLAVEGDGTFDRYTGTQPDSDR